MKIFVTGASGMLGHTLCRTLEANGIEYEVSGEWDFCDFDQIKCFLSHLNCDDVVINCAGLIRQRMSKYPLADEIKKALILNGTFPHMLAEKCHLIHISTDCVFSGKTGMYSENNVPDPLDIYGQSKAVGEPGNALVLRQSLVGPEVNNHLGMFSWFMKQEHRATGFAHHYWNGLTTNTLSKCIVKILNKKMYITKGIRHLFSDTVTKYDMCQMWNSHREHPIQLDMVCGYPVIDRTLNTCHPEFKAHFSIPPLSEQFKEMMT